MLRRNIKGIEIESASPSDNGGMSIRISDVSYGDIDGKKVELRGCIELTNKPSDCGFIISLFDCTGGRLLPIQSTSSRFQEKGSTSFSVSAEVENIDTEIEFFDWTLVGYINAWILNGPFEDTRNLMAVVRLVDHGVSGSLRNGRVVPTDKILWTGIKKFKLDLYDEGYIESLIRLRRFHFTSIGLALLIAKSVGEITHKATAVIEAKILDWLNYADSDRQIYDGYSSYEERSQSYIAHFNQALQKVKDRTLSQSRLFTELMQCCTSSSAIELIKFCFDVMIADGIIKGQTLELIDKIAKAAKIDLNKLANIRDEKIVRLDKVSKFDLTAEQFLGINSHWKRNKKIDHLEAEFHKWNSRLNVVPEGNARENIQRLLHMIGDALKQYR
ncbi:MAG: hypothetical protein OXE59_05735 [Bacteroidetes bacterium]|nr:hypothetical protein [Bacteroidota bacterium]